MNHAGRTQKDGQSPRSLKAACVLTALVVAAPTAGATSPPPSGEYLDPGDMGIYLYNNVTNGLLYLRACGAECDAVPGPGQSGQCSYYDVFSGSTDWYDPATAYASVGACVNVRVTVQPGGDSVFFRHRASAREVNYYQSYSVVATGRWLDAGGNTIRTVPLDNNPTFCPGAIAAVAPVCLNDYALGTTDPKPAGAVTFCGRDTMRLEDGTVHREVEVCVPV